MKKSFICILVLLLLLFVSCSNEAGEKNKNSSEEISGTSDSQFFSDVSFLKYFTANISSSTESIGRVESSSLSGGSRGIDSSPNYLLVKKEEGSSQVEPVTFTANKDLKINGRKIKAGDEVSQGEITRSVDKVYVIGRYTLVSFLTFDIDSILNDSETTVSNQGYRIYYMRDWWETEPEDVQKETRESDYFGFQSFEYKDEEHDNTTSACIYKHIYKRDETGQWQEVTQYEYRDEIFHRCAANDVPALNEKNGISTYDTFDYYTSMFRQSFIIDNNTGSIYAIPESIGENKINLSVYRGVVIDKNLGPVKLSVNSSGELVLEQILANKDVIIYDVFKDSYNQYYIRTNSLSEIDGNVLFFNVCGEYMPTQDGRILHVTYNNLNDMYGHDYQITGISFVGNGFSDIPMAPNASVNIFYSTSGTTVHGRKNHDCIRCLYDYNYSNGHNNLHEGDALSAGSSAKFQKIRNGVLYYQLVSNAGHYLKSYEYNLENGETLLSVYNNSYDNYFALLNDTDCIGAIKQSNNTYSLCLFNPSELNSIFSSRRYFNNDGSLKYDYYGNYEDSCVWLFAYLNDMAREYDSSIDGPDKSSTYRIQIDGNSLTVKLKDGYDYETVKELYRSSGRIKKELLSNVSITNSQIDWYSFQNANNISFKVARISGTEKYKIVKDRNGNYDVVLASSSVFDTTTITLQPINR